VIRVSLVRGIRRVSSRAGRCPNAGSQHTHCDRALDPVPVFWLQAVVSAREYAWLRREPG
jgi:hypothetical protein